MKRALIIGAGGFVGEYLVNCILKQEKWDVFATKMKMESWEQQIPCFDVDILEKEQIVQVLNEVQPDYIFHLAAQSSVALSWKRATFTVDVNIKGCLNLLEAVRETKLNSRILLIGSSEEYGKSLINEEGITEIDTPQPTNVYAVTKLCQNLLGKVYAEAYKMEIVSVRAFNHIGPKQRDDFVISSFCKQVAEIEKGKKEPIISVGNLEAARDFTDVRDVVQAYVELIKCGKSGETYNVGTGKAIKISEVLEYLLSLSEEDIVVKTDPTKFRPIDVPSIQADIRKLQECTGWQPNVSWKDTVKEMLEYWKNVIR